MSVHENDIVSQQITTDDENINSRSAFDRLSSEMARIEAIVVAGGCSATNALRQVVHAIAGIDGVNAVNICKRVGDEFVSVAVEGFDSQSVPDCITLYEECYAANRFVRRDLATGSSAASVPFSCMMVAPFSTPAGPVGVLAVFSDRMGTLSDDFIVPISTA